MNIFNRVNSLFKRSNGNPMRDWLGLLTCSAIALVGIVVWNMWAFDTISQGGVIGTPANSSPAVFSGSSLDTINTIFASRADEEAKYRTGVYNYADPSQ